MASRNQADLWRELVAEAGEDASVQASQVTSADAERDLASVGFDVAQERAEAVANLRALESRAAPVRVDAGTPSEEQAWIARVPPIPMRVRPVPTRWYWLVAATLALATAGGLLYGLAHRPKPVDFPREVPTLEAPAPTVPARPPEVPSVVPTETLPAMGPKPH
ncbi:MAG TPA: hypothetical protein VK841_08375 [Polyangiaceae bacterium]|jgi:hypothetical protein|nr:hypothetical protein [Polyangiaceae bacterium]